MNFRFGFTLVDKSLLLLGIAVLALNEIVVVSLPVTFGSLGFHNFVVSLNIKIVLLQVLVGHDVVVAGWHLGWLRFIFLRGN